MQNLCVDKAPSPDSKQNQFSSVFFFYKSSIQEKKEKNFPNVEVEPIFIVFTFSHFCRTKTGFKLLVLSDALLDFLNRIWKDDENQDWKTMT